MRVCVHAFVNCVCAWVWVRWRCRGADHHASGPQSRRRTRRSGCSRHPPGLRCIRRPLPRKPRQARTGCCRTSCGSRHQRACEQSCQSAGPARTRRGEKQDGERERAAHPWGAPCVPLNALPSAGNVPSHSTSWLMKTACSCGILRTRRDNHRTFLGLRQLQCSRVGTCERVFLPIPAPGVLGRDSESRSRTDGWLVSAFVVNYSCTRLLSGCGF